MFFNDTVVCLLQVCFGLIIFQPVLIHGILLVDFIGFLDFISRLRDTSITGVTCLARSFPYRNNFFGCFFIGIYESSKSLRCCFLGVLQRLKSVAHFYAVTILKVFVRAERLPIMLLSFWQGLTLSEAEPNSCRDNPMVGSYVSEGALCLCVEKTFLPLPSHEYSPTGT